MKKIILSSVIALLVTAVVSLPRQAQATTVNQDLPKVTVCHNGNSISISISALGTHLGHGDKAGACSTATPKPTATAKPDCTPTATPTVSPTASPSATPTVEPSVTPSPTATPSESPTVAPTSTPQSNGGSSTYIPPVHITDCRYEDCNTQKSVIAPAGAQLPSTGSDAVVNSLFATLVAGVGVALKKIAAGIK